MKDLEGKTYYNTKEIYEKLENRITKEKLNDLFSNKKIPGKRIDNQWYGDETVLDEIEEILFGERAIMINTVEIDISRIPLRGRILDIGGGGEGIIGQYKGRQVVAIDLRDSELREAPEGEYLKIIMDAKDLKFLDEYFDTATAFFSLMYVPPIDRKKIFGEVYRILKKEGEFAIWDLIIPEKYNNNKDFYGLQLKIDIGERVISTGYATRWNRVQSSELYSNLGESVGFEITENSIDDHIFYIKFLKN
jgi:ubiquinone/menaquinone biosynthesis C-methylase UbiE